MSQNSSQKSKRRPPGEKATDVQQDADWGFDPDEADPAIEKKLGIALVLCLLAGFGFVFYQKFRILRNSETQVVADTEDVVVPDASALQTGDAEDVVPGADAATPVIDQGNTVEVRTESPFYEPPEMQPPGHRGEESLTLTQAEVLQQERTRTPPGELPPLPESTPNESFDPFAGSDESVEVPPAPPASDLESSDPLELSWDAPTATVDMDELPANDGLPQQEEPQLPLQIDTAHQAAEPDTPVDSPFMVLEQQAPEPASADENEPQKLILSEVAGPQPANEVRSPAGDADTAPPEPEPMLFDSSSDIDKPSLSEPDRTSTSSPSFDPFPPAADAVPEAAVEPATPSTVSDAPLEFPASPSDNGPPAETPGLFPEPEALAGSNGGLSTESTSNNLAAPSKAVVEPPAWPFAGNSGSSGTTEESSPVSTAESPPEVMIFEGTPTQREPDAAQPKVSAEASPNPFATQSSIRQPIPSVGIAAQPVIGEREITVTPSDSFWSISEREYGSSRYYTALARHNSDRVARPEALQSGMKIKVPPPEVLEDRFPEFFRRTATNDGPIAPMSGASATAPQRGLFVDDQQRPHYRVGENETLSSIAQQHLGRSSRWTEIYDLNRDRLKSPSTLKIGMVLKLPPADGKASVSPAGGFSR